MWFFFFFLCVEKEIPCRQLVSPAPIARKHQSFPAFQQTMTRVEVKNTAMWTKIQQCMKMSTPPSLRCYGSNTLKYNAGKVYQNFLTSRACQSSAGQNPLTCLQLTYLLYDIGQNLFFCMLGIVSFKKPSHVQSCIYQIVQ